MLLLVSFSLLLSLSLLLLRLPPNAGGLTPSKLLARVNHDDLIGGQSYINIGGLVARAGVGALNSGGGTPSKSLARINHYDLIRRARINHYWRTCLLGLFCFINRWGGSLIKSGGYVL